MSKVRGFEVISYLKDENIKLPERQTKNSAGYDFEAAEDVYIESIWKVAAKRLVAKVNPIAQDSFKFAFEGDPIKPKLVRTGIKAYMQEDEALFLYNRSSNPLRKFLILGNGVGVIDSDYYNNIKNEGEIMFQFYNLGLWDITIRKGERIGQGVFKKFLKADNDNASGERTGGHGSTSKE